MNVTHAHYSEKRKYEIQFVMNIFEKLNLCEYLIHVFVSTNEIRH